SSTRPVCLVCARALVGPWGFPGGGGRWGFQPSGGPGEESPALRMGHAYERAAGWNTRRPPLEAGPVPQPAAPPAPPAGSVDAQWVLDFARLTGLRFVTEADATPVAAALSPVKAQLAEGRERLAPSCEPPVRSAPAEGG